MAYIVTSRMRRNLEPRWPFALSGSSALAQGVIAAFPLFSQQGRHVELVEGRKLLNIGTVDHVVEPGYGASTYIPSGSGNYIGTSRQYISGLSAYTLFADSWFSTGVDSTPSGFYFGQGAYGSTDYDGGFYVGGANDNQVFFYKNGGSLSAGLNTLDTLRRQYHTGIFQESVTNGADAWVWNYASAGLQSYGPASPGAGTPGATRNFYLCGGYSTVFPPNMWWKGGLVYKRALRQHEIERLHAPNWPSLVFEEYGRTLYFIGAVGGGAISLSPGAGTLTLTGSTPSLRLELARDPTAGSLTITGSTPTLQIGSDIALSPGAGALTITGSTPARRLELLRSPGQGDLTIVGSTPSLEVLGAFDLEPASGSIVITGSTPSLTFTLARDPTAGLLTLTGSQPTLEITGLKRAGGIGKRRRYRRVMIDGRLYRVRSPAELAALLAERRAELELDLVQAQDENRPTTQIRRRIKRIENRLETVQAEVADWRSQLQRDDEELVLIWQALR